MGGPREPPRQARSATEPLCLATWRAAARLRRRVEQSAVARGYSEVAHFPCTNDDATSRLPRATNHSARRNDQRHLVAGIDVDLIADRRPRPADRVGDEL